jgi:hypothetical protein
MAKRTNPFSIVTRSDITLDALKADGWDETKDPVCPITKKIENRNPLNASEDSDIKLGIHKMYNCETFAVILPDGGMLNFQVNSMAELQAFEKAIKFYDPPF